MQKLHHKSCKNIIRSIISLSVSDTNLSVQNRSYCYESWYSWRGVLPAVLSQDFSENKLYLPQLFFFSPLPCPKALVCCYAFTFAGFEQRQFRSQKAKCLHFKRPKVITFHAPKWLHRSDFVVCVSALVRLTLLQFCPQAPPQSRYFVDPEDKSLTCLSMPETQSKSRLHSKWRCVRSTGRHTSTNFNFSFTGNSSCCNMTAGTSESAVHCASDLGDQVTFYPFSNCQHYPQLLNWR